MRHPTPQWVPNVLSRPHFTLTREFGKVFMRTKRHASLPDLLLFKNARGNIWRKNAPATILSPFPLRIDLLVGHVRNETREIKEKGSGWLIKNENLLTRRSPTDDISECN